MERNVDQKLPLNIPTKGPHLQFTHAMKNFIQPGLSKKRKKYQRRHFESVNQKPKNFQTKSSLQLIIIVEPFQIGKKTLTICVEPFFFPPLFSRNSRMSKDSILDYFKREQETDLTQQNSLHFLMCSRLQDSALLKLQRNNSNFVTCLYG